MEHPSFTYQDIYIVMASTPEEACEQYNKKLKCNYFYGTCLGLAENLQNFPILES